MNSRERVLQALNRQEPDRIPRDLGGTESSGMTAYSLFNLQTHLGLPQNLKIFEPYQYVAYIGDNLIRRFRIDTVNLTIEPRCWTKIQNPSGFNVLLPEKWTEEKDVDGATVVRREGGVITAKRPKGGYYFEPVNPPLRSVEKPAELRQYKKTIFSFDLPSFADEHIEDLQQRAQVMRSKGNCTIFNLCCHFLAAGQILRGYENFMVDLLSNEVLVKELLDLLIEGYCSRIDWLAPILRESVDVVLLNDDLGTQNGAMLSPNTYRKILKPYHNKLITHAKRSFEARILFHSCGGVRDFIPDLIEIGVDALNPVQTSAIGMSPKALKHDFGKDITFWGGGVDTQSVLNMKSPSEVRDAVRQNVDILAPGGGFVFSQVHNIQPDVPPDNVLAMFSALDECGGY
jgi:uroporphyrinogen decarboxylase